ncbi:TetR/AcrR family transcriptional regulator [Hydrocarboniphaga sp.]|uniref:TetR/AcrR family transcriptional regulator n=1 Tax=Hydrocarboniphaga sp. TaxID=2033016 RepID=UPI003D0C8DFF
MDGLALARLRPESLAHIADDERNPRWQQRKSLATRNALLDAALLCLAEDGYGGCSLQSVANRARVSRGAMLHHYASKLELMSAVIEYAFYRRMALFLERIRALSDDERMERNLGIAVSYRISQTPEYRAYLECHIASRTDPELRAIFLQRSELYHHVWSEEVRKVFPEWGGDPRLDMLNDFVWVMVDGLALNSDIWDDEVRVQTIIDFVAQTIRRLRLGDAGT